MVMKQSLLSESTVQDLDWDLFYFILVSSPAALTWTEYNITLKNKIKELIDILINYNF